MVKAIAQPGALATILNTQSWNYDDAGNCLCSTQATQSVRLSSEVLKGNAARPQVRWDSTTIDGSTENRSHNAADQITLISPATGSPATAGNDLKGNLTAFTYDVPTPIGTVETDYILEWDLDNRLKKTTVDNDDVEYRYDALGRRVIRKQGTDETALIWWGDSECAEYEHATGQACIQNDIFAHPTQLNAVVARAVEGDENDLQWYHKNYLDHVYAVSDDGGDLIEHYRYSAFGEIEIFDELGNRILASAINNQITWNTRRLDTLSGFYLYKYRHYSPQLGRWPSRDPIEEHGGYNLYGFVGNDGVNGTDVLGMVEIPVPGDLPTLPGLPDLGFDELLGALDHIPRCAAIVKKHLEAIRAIALSSANSLAFAAPNYDNMPFQHCVWNCRMTLFGGQGYAEGMSLFKELLDKQIALMGSELKAAGCWSYVPGDIQHFIGLNARSAFQPADFRDNKTGRECGENIAKNFNGVFWKNIAMLTKQCEKCCEKRGVKPDSEEGPGTSRPFGPYVYDFPEVDKKTCVEDDY